MYVAIALILMGLLVITLTRGVKKDVNSTLVDEMVLYLQSDIQTIHASAAECAQSYPEKVDQDGDGTDDYANPNIPWPLYHGMGSGGAGETITNILCPAAPDAKQTIFGTVLNNRMKLLSDTGTYTTTYFTDNVEGVYVRIVRGGASPIWEEAISRLNDKFAPCSAAIDSGASPSVFYYWIVRLSPGGGLAPEAGCP